MPRHPARRHDQLKCPAATRTLRCRPALLTVTEAARALGIHQSKLTTQINRLEKDRGRPLIERAERGRRMRPTPFSGMLAAAAKRLTGLGGRL